MISVAIVHHPDRDISAMLSALDFPATICVDEGQGLVKNYRAAWEAHDPRADWHLVLEDDLLLPRGFQQSAEAALAGAPSLAPVSFFQIAPRYRDAYNAGFSWYVDNGVNWSQALALPSWLVPDFLEWEQANVSERHHWFCQRMTSWAQNKMLPVLYTLPCLVEHLDRPSLVGNPRLAGGVYPRVASSFVDPAPPSRYWLGPATGKANHRRLPPESLH